MRASTSLPNPVREWDGDYSLVEQFQMARPKWMKQAACRGMDINVFFPTTKHIAPAIGTCRYCPVRRACNDYAIRHGLVGIWGGRTYTRKN